MPDAFAHRRGHAPPERSVITAATLVPEVEEGRRVTFAPVGIELPPRPRARPHIACPPRGQTAPSSPEEARTWPNVGRPGVEEEGVWRARHERQPGTSVPDSLLVWPADAWTGASVPRRAQRGCPPIACSEPPVRMNCRRKARATAACTTRSPAFVLGNLRLLDRARPSGRHAEVSPPGGPPQQRAGRLRRPVGLGDGDGTRPVHGCRDAERTRGLPAAAEGLVAPALPPSVNRPCIGDELPLIARGVQLSLITPKVSSLRMAIESPTGWSSGCTRRADDDLAHAVADVSRAALSWGASVGVCSWPLSESTRGRKITRRTGARDRRRAAAGADRGSWLWQACGLGGCGSAGALRRRIASRAS
jgi:hypothetical protein